VLFLHCATTPNAGRPDSPYRQPLSERALVEAEDDGGEGERAEGHAREQAERVRSRRCEVASKSLERKFGK
jgi:hypothetical protein